MNSQPLVSAIIIFLNGEKYIVEAIESVLAQTYDNWELLLVDDGSTDKSTEIARKYADTYPEKVHYLEHENHSNRGMSASRNLGIHHARGEYITLLDADDVWLPQKMEKQVAILQTHPEVALVYGASLIWHSWTGKAEDKNKDCFRTLGVFPDTLIQPPTLLNSFLRGNAQTPGTCSVMLRREAVIAVGGFEENFRGMYEDQAFFSKICLEFPTFVESGSWDKYRQHLDSTCHIAAKTGQFHFAKMSASQEKYLIWLEQYLLQKQLQNTEAFQILQAKLLIVRYPIFRLLENLKHFGQRIKVRLMMWMDFVKLKNPVQLGNGDIS